VVEVDGDHHAFQIEADSRRTAAMERNGWRVLRFRASEVLASREGVAAAIAQALTIPLTQPLPQGGEEPDSDCSLHVPLPLGGEGR
jgi:very-short-patch-repair endonuclease